MNKHWQNMQNMQINTPETLQINMHKICWICNYVFRYAKYVKRNMQNMLYVQNMQNNMYKICSEYANKNAEYVNKYAK